jgi:hypothetical protein
MINTPHEQSLPEAFEIGDHSFDTTDSFKYLGVVVTKKNEVQKSKPKQLLEMAAILQRKGF